MSGNFISKNFAGDTYDNHCGAETIANIVLNNQNRARAGLLTTHIFAQISKVNLTTSNVHIPVYEGTPLLVILVDICRLLGL